MINLNCFEFIKTEAVHKHKTPWYTEEVKDITRKKMLTCATEELEHQEIGYPTHKNETSLTKNKEVKTKLLATDYKGNGERPVRITDKMWL